GGVGEAVDEHDLAATIGAREIRRAPFAEIDHLRLEAVSRRRPRKGMGNAFELTPAQLRARGARKADVGVMRQKRGAIAVTIEAGFEIAETFELLRRAGKLHALRELGAMAHQLLAVHGGARFTRDVIHDDGPRWGGGFMGALVFRPPLS